jgi:hypothetical protein
VLRFSGFELDSERAELCRPDGGTIRLRPKTLEILRLLAGSSGRVLSKQQLMEAVWPNVYVGEDSLFQCIREIRTALGDDKRQVVRVISGLGGGGDRGPRPCGAGNCARRPARADRTGHDGDSRNEQRTRETVFRLQPA